MHIILLPGLDGTGLLFNPLLPYLSDYKTSIIPLPETGKQDYESLSQYVQSKLPPNDCIIIAESFSGPIAKKLPANTPQIKGVIFVATFLSTPNALLLSLIHKLPLKVLSKLPFARKIYQYFLLGKNCPPDLMAQFEEIIAQLEPRLIQSRLKSIQNLSCVEEIENQSKMPALYIQANGDRVIPSSKATEFQKCFSKIDIHKIDGAHFLLQVKPEECATIIKGFITQRGKAYSS